MILILFQVISSWQETGKWIWNVFWRRRRSKREEGEISLQHSSKCQNKFRTWRAITFTVNLLSIHTCSLFYTIILIYLPTCSMSNTVQRRNQTEMGVEVEWLKSGLGALVRKPMWDLGILPTEILNISGTSYWIFWYFLDISINSWKWQIVDIQLFKRHGRKGVLSPIWFQVCRTGCLTMPV